MATAAKLVDICAAPRNGVAPYSKALAANFATTDLTTQSGKPDHAAQLVEFFNAGTATENAVYTTIDGESHTTPIAAGSRWAPAAPVSSVNTSSDADVSAEVFWWPALGYAINP